MRSTMLAICNFIIVGLALARPGDKAINPSLSGQIGINPVSYLGSDTQYFSDEPSTTVWIGSGSAIPITVTDSAGDIQITSVPIGVSTVTAASGNNAVGDLNFIFSPDGASELNNLFIAVNDACGVGTTKLKDRQIDSCALGYINAEGPAPGVFSDPIAAGVEFVVDSDTAATLGLAGVSVGMVAIFRAFLNWQTNGGQVPQVIKIPAINVGTSPAPTPTSTSSSTVTPAPLLTDIYETVGTAFNTSSASVLDLYLQQLFMGAPSSASASTTAPPACTCTNVITPNPSGGGFSSAVDCPFNLPDNNLNCALVTSTQAPVPSPSPPSTPACNSNRILPSFVPPAKSSQTFNTVAASSAAINFCNSRNYTFNELNCPASNSYPFTGSTLNGDNGGIGAAGGLGTIERIYLATRWSTPDCDPKTWWAGSDPTQTFANAYITGDTIVQDCITGFKAAIIGCVGSSDSSMGALLSYNCMEYLVFPSNSAQLDLANNVGGGCSFISWK